VLRNPAGQKLEFPFSRKVNIDNKHRYHQAGSNPIDEILSPIARIRKNHDLDKGARPGNALSQGEQLWIEITWLG
jgi:hypothetical protein